MGAPLLPFRSNTLYRELLGILGLNFADGYDSSSRKQMLGSHIGQRLVIKEPTVRSIQTGIERELAKYTFSKKFDVDASVVKIIDRYRKTPDRDSINLNPQTVVIYEDVKTNEICLLDLRNYCSYHQHFGFPYRQTSDFAKLSKSANFKAGTVLLDSTSVDEDGNFMYGRQANVAFMSHPGIAEDGVIANSETLKKFAFKKYERVVVSFGETHYPLNMYGTEKFYKIFPDVGEHVRFDGLLMALREYDDYLSIIEMDTKSTMDYSAFFDQTVFVKPGGKIIDIVVHHDNKNNNPPTPSGMDVQPLKYDNARRVFYTEVLNEYNRLLKSRGDQLAISPEFHQLVVDAIAIVGNKDQKVNFKYKNNPLDDWRIEFIIEYDVVPGIGFKVTDIHGGLK